MVDEAVLTAAAREKARREALFSTARLLRLRLDPRLLVADVATGIMRRSIYRAGTLDATPKQRKRAVIGGVLAVATAIGMRMLFRSGTRETLSRREGLHVKRLG